MVTQKPVSVNWQTLFILIPIIDLWAAYRVEKLGLYILLIIALAVVGFIVGFVEGFLFFGMSDFFSWIVVLVGVIISIILIRSWSTEWNEKFGKSDDDEFTEDGVTYKYDNDDVSPSGVTYKYDNDDDDEFTEDGVTYKKD